MMKLVSIPENRYFDYRCELIFTACKWDPQVSDRNSVARHVLFIDRNTAEEIESAAEGLARETVLLENALRVNPELARELWLPRQVFGALKHRLSDYDAANHIRVMRFDFHPTDEGWAVSEVNSDVPGGYAESSVWPEIACKITGGIPWKNTADCLISAFRHKVRSGGTLAFVHCTSYSDDKQVMQYLGDRFEAEGFHAVYAAPDHIVWKDRRAVYTLGRREIDGIVRFFPLEWLPELPKNADWKGFYDTVTPSCNHPVAMFAQSKRFPLIWDKTGIELPFWRKYLPETLDPRVVRQSGYILKPALGRVGDRITVPGSMSEKDIRKAEKDARLYRKEWISQKMFRSTPLKGQDGTEYHLCLGAFTVDGKGAGFYARISPHARIDSVAEDISVVINEQ